MATVSGGEVGWTNYSDSCGYHAGHFKIDGLKYNQVQRSGNTVTVKGIQVNGNLYMGNVNKGSCGFYGWQQGWAGKMHIWRGSSNTQGTDWIGSSGTIDISQGGLAYWYDDPHIMARNAWIGDVSFTVGANDTSYKLRAGFAFSRNNGGSGTGRDGTDKYVEFTVTFPAAVKTLDVNGSKDGNATGNTAGMGTFDVTINGSKKGDNVTDYYNSSVTYNASYKVDDIRETSNNYYYVGNSSYSGTMSANQTVVLPFKSTTAPSGISAALVSRAWNSIVAKATVNSYGAPGNRSGRYVEVGLAPASGNAYSARVLFQSTSNVTSTGNKTFNQSNDSSSFIVAGARSFKIGGYASNTKKTNSVLNTTVYWLPPHNMVSCTLQSTARNATNVTFRVRMKGANADNVNNISGARVDTQYRYSTDNGSTYTAWANATTNRDPAANIDVDISVPYNKDVVFQTRQATTGDTSQVCGSLTLNIAAVRPLPTTPVITCSWEELKRRATIKVTGAAGGASGDAIVAKNYIELSYDNFATVFGSTTITANPSVWNVDYLKPTKTLYIRARTTNNFDKTSSWATASYTVPRPIWGVVTDFDADNKVEKRLIRDMVKVSASGTVSPRDWIEGSNTGKRRIVKK